jgi:hypothetical protein
MLGDCLIGGREVARYIASIAMPWCCEWKCLLIRGFSDRVSAEMTESVSAYRTKADTGGFAAKVGEADE